MQITMSIMIDLPASGTIAEVEPLWWSRPGSGRPLPRRAGQRLGAEPRSTRRHGREGGDRGGGAPPRGTRGRQRLARRRSVATFGDAERLGLLTYAAAHALGAARAARQTVLDDGADWIKTQADLHFPEVTAMLDWPHLARTVHKAIRAALPGAANAERRGVRQEIPDLLWDGYVEVAATELADLLPDGAQPVAALTNLATRRAWLGDSGAWRDAGEPVGSGMVERDVALVINRGFKRQGMRWRRANADAVVALRTRTIDATWLQLAA